MKKDAYKQATLENKDDPIVIKFKKKILINKIVWTILTAIAFILIFVFAFVGKAKGWDADSGKKRLWIALIVIPIAITGALGFMTVMIYLGNEVAVKIFNNHKIIFYSGPNNNVLYIDGKFIGKGSTPELLSYKFEDGNMVVVYLATIDYEIATGKDLVINPFAKKKEEKKPEEAKPEQPAKPVEEAKPTVAA